MKHFDFSGSILQVAEISQASGSRLAALSRLCHMQPAKFMLNAQCSMLNQGGLFI